MWQGPVEVARSGLDGLAKNRAIVIPGGVNKVMGNLAAVTPHGITRRVSAMVMKRAEH
jgi:short-subunit dehydrogenase